MTPSAFLERVTSIARLHDLRAFASRKQSELDIDRVAIETVVLVLSETCTNAFTHGGAEVVEVELGIDELDGGGGSTITMWVRHEDHDAAGRGLALVERLVDGMTLWIDPPCVVRRCWLHTGGTASG